MKPQQFFTSFCATFVHIIQYYETFDLCIVLCAGIGHAMAQDVYTSSGKSVYHKKSKKKKGYDPDKLILGGGLGFDLGDGYLSAGISPMVGYRFTDHFSAGVGLGYEYFQLAVENNPANPTKYLYEKENLIYPSIWTRYFFWRNWYVSGQFEYDLIRLSYPLDNYGNVNTTITNVTNPCLLVGVGYRFPMGGRASFFVEGLYDVLQGKYSPYPQGLISTLRFGIAVGL